MYNEEKKEEIEEEIVIENAVKSFKKKIFDFKSVTIKVVNIKIAR